MLVPITLRMVFSGSVGQKQRKGQLENDRLDFP